MDDRFLLCLLVLFFVFTCVEVYLSKRNNHQTYRINDSLVNIMLGLLTMVTNTVVTGVYFLIYLFPYNHFRFFTISSNNVPIWILTFLYFDFVSYIIHVLDHKINWFWAGHVVHHQPDFYNLSVAYRVPSTAGYYEWLYFLPLAILGVPPLFIGIIMVVQTIYQFMVHTNLSCNFGWFGKIFVTPNDHRVHHGFNKLYIDKNFGAILIVWDKLFGTFQKELPTEPIKFGTTQNIKSFNPFYVNFQHFIHIFKLVIHSKNMKERFSHIFLSPSAIKGKHNITNTDLKNSSSISNANKKYCIAGFSIFVILVLIFIAFNKILPYVARLISLICLWFTASILGKLFEGEIHP